MYRQNGNLFRYRVIGTGKFIMRNEAMPIIKYGKKHKLFNLKAAPTTAHVLNALCNTVCHKL